MQLLEATVRLKNKTALITGGNSGIGLATAKLFVAEGARVDITGRNQATLEAAAKELGPNALAIVADATDIGATEKAVAKAVEKFGKLDIVFANAGISASTPVGGTSLETFESVLKTNITAVLFTIHAPAPPQYLLPADFLHGTRNFGAPYLRLHHLRRDQSAAATAGGPQSPRPS